MKTLLTISALIVICYNPFLKAGDDPSFKIYQVTETGSFHFTYPDADISSKQGVKPVTIRTFYLETMRHGLLPSDLSYEDFLQLTPEEIQAMIEQNQQLLLAAREADKSHAGYIIRNMPSAISCVRLPLNSYGPDGAVKTTDENGVQLPATHETLYLPWVVKVIIDPEDGYVLPDFDNMPSEEVNPGMQKLELPETARILTKNNL